MIFRPYIGTRDCLRHQHVPLVSRPNEDIVQQLSVSPPTAHPHGLHSHLKTDVGVGPGETVFHAGSQEKQATIIGAVEVICAQHASPGNMVCADADVDVIEDNQLIRLRHGHQKCVQVLLGYTTYSLSFGSREEGGIDADHNHDKFAPLPTNIQGCQNERTHPTRPSSGAATTKITNATTVAITTTTTTTTTTTITTNTTTTTITTNASTINNIVKTTTTTHRPEATIRRQLMKPKDPLPD
nr:unnamed protein product [Spirometra erinaceieuropaei]